MRFVVNVSGSALLVCGSVPALFSATVGRITHEYPGVLKLDYYRTSPPNHSIAHPSSSSGLSAFILACALRSAFFCTFLAYLPMSCFFCSRLWMFGET